MILSPTDHTSDETVYVPRLFWDSPLIRSGWEDVRQFDNDDSTAPQLTAM